MRKSYLTFLIVICLAFVAAPGPAQAQWFGKKDTEPSFEDIMAEGLKLVERKLYDAAVLKYDEAVAADPDSAHAYASRAYCYLMKGAPDVAIKDYTHAIELVPDYRDAFKGRATAYFTMQNFNKSTEDYTRAIKIDPDDAGLYMNRGINYSILRDRTAAMKDFNKVIELAPQNPNGYYNRGVIYLTMEKFQKALADFSYTLKLDPERYDALNNRALIYFRLKEYQKSKQDMDRLKKNGIPLPAGMEEALDMALANPKDFSRRLQNLEQFFETGRIPGLGQGDAAPSQAVEAGEKSEPVVAERPQRRVIPAATPAPAVKQDIIILKSGKKIAGKIVEQTDDHVRIEIEGIPITYYSDEIEKVE